MNIVENTDTSSNGDLLHSATDEKKKIYRGSFVIYTTQNVQTS